MSELRRKLQKNAGLLTESQSNHYSPADFIDRKTNGIGGQSNLQGDMPANSIPQDIDVNASADDVHAGIQYELGRMIKKNPTLARQIVLTNILRDPNYYRDLKQVTSEVKWSARPSPPYPGSEFVKDAEYAKNVPKDALSDKLAAIDDKADIEHAKQVAKAFLKKKQELSEIDFVRKNSSDNNDDKYNPRSNYHPMPDDPEWKSFFHDYGPKKNEPRNNKSVSLNKSRFGVNEIDFARPEDRPEDKDKKLPVGGGEDTSFKPQIMKKIEIPDDVMIEPDDLKDLPPTNLQMEIVKNFRESIKKMFPTSNVESRTNGVIIIKDNIHSAAFKPLDRYDQFTIFIQTKDGKEVEFKPFVTRKELQKVLEKYFGKKSQKRW